MPSAVALDLVGFVGALRGAAELADRPSGSGAGHGTAVRLRRPAVADGEALVEAGDQLGEPLEVDVFGGDALELRVRDVGQIVRPSGDGSKTKSSALFRRSCSSRIIASGEASVRNGTGGGGGTGTERRARFGVGTMILWPQWMHLPCLPASASST